tara:strand:- start:4458 stop:5135 length:678 start_codon:yes stop_codon:yes gene_type:complete
MSAGQLQGLGALGRDLSRISAERQAAAGDPRRLESLLAQEEQQRLRQEEEEQKRLQEELFQDPKYRNIATILGPQFAFQQRESDIAEEEQKTQQQALQKELNKAIDESNLPKTQKELLKQLDVKTQASVLFREPEPEPGKQEVIDSIIRKIQRGQTLTEQEQKLYDDIVLRPTPQERLLGQFGGMSQSQPQPRPSIVPTITTQEEFDNLPSGAQFYYERNLNVKE